MQKEGTSQADHVESVIKKEREYEKVKQRLYDEFKVLDVNQDGTITLQEIVDFLKEKVTLFLNTCRVEGTWTPPLQKIFSKRLMQMVQGQCQLKNSLSPTLNSREK